MSNGLLFTLCALIWGTTWIAITFQHGDMSPMYSVGIRFALAAAMLGGWCLFRKLSLKLPLRTHFTMLGVGCSLYTLDYVFLYFSQQYIVSGILAVLSASVVYFTVLLRTLVMRKPLRMEVLLGASISAAGLYLLFAPELADLELGAGVKTGLLLACVSFFFAAVGNVLSETGLDESTPVVQFNFFAMSYSLLFTFGFAAISDQPFALPETSSYWLSLLYLALFGSVFAFGAYMKLVKNMGADKSSNVILVYPLVALLVSTLFEDYRWTLAGILGVICIMLGNSIAMDKLQLRHVNFLLNRFLPSKRKRA